MALLLPAIQAAREAARRTECINRLKQFGIAHQNYHDTYGAFVYRKGGTTGPTNDGTNNQYRRSGYVSLLPFLEQQAQYDQIFFHPTQPQGPAGWTGWAEWNDAPDVLLCPSDNGYPHKNGPFLSYVMCMGDQISNLGDDQNPRGIFGRQLCARMRDITDGTSNTALMSERLCQERVVGYRNSDPTPAAARAVEYVLAVATRVGGIANSPVICYTAVQDAYFAAGQPIQARFGTRWTDGQPMHVGFTTVFPPNAPACADGGNNADSYTAILPPASRHPGGVNLVLADGSVVFISNSIDTGNLGVGQTRQGPSNYGVWGALGSKDGGEAISSFR